MDVVSVFLSKALICFAATCQPVLIGDDTKPGRYELHAFQTNQPGYGGDVLLFDHDATGWFAIHRTYTLGNTRNRPQLYSGTTPAQRTVSAGCINVQPEVYEQLKDCCTGKTLVILP